MLRALLISLVVLIALGCKKSDDKKKLDPIKQTAPVEVGVVKDGARRIDVLASQKGYDPERIAGKPGEKLILVFKRTVEGECLEELRTPEGKVVKLPMNEPVEVPVTLPDKGEVTFACGMDMFRGTIVVQPGA